MKRVFRSEIIVQRLEHFWRSALPHIRPRSLLCLYARHTPSYPHRGMVSVHNQFCTNPSLSSRWLLSQQLQFVRKNCFRPLVLLIVCCWTYWLLDILD
jgi:hypothetical protein